MKKHGLCLILCSLLLLLPGLGLSASSPPAVVRPPAVGWLIAVFPLEALSPASDMTGAGVELSGILTDALTRAGRVRVVERRRLQHLMEELQLSLHGLLDEQTAVRAGRLLGANALILGSFLRFGDTVRISLRVVHTETGEVLASERVAGPHGQLFELGDRLAAGIVRRLLEIRPPEPARSRVSPAGGVG